MSSALPPFLRFCKKINEEEDLEESVSREELWKSLPAAEREKFIKEYEEEISRLSKSKPEEVAVHAAAAKRGAAAGPADPFQRPLSLAEAKRKAEIAIEEAARAPEQGEQTDRTSLRRLAAARIRRNADWMSDILFSSKESAEARMCPEPSENNARVIELLQSAVEQSEIEAREMEAAYAARQRFMADSSAREGAAPNAEAAGPADESEEWNDGTVRWREVTRPCSPLTTKGFLVKL
eukprot:m.51427 g.51427  ORF g.51427 m.51427 type:complete len:237 (-) comp11688_c0_seq2:21-731(-)